MKRGPQKVGSWKDLATALGCSIRLLHSLRHLPGAPVRDEQEGTHDVTAWRTFKIHRESQPLEPEELTTKKLIELEDLRRKKTANDLEDGLLVRKEDLVLRCAPLLQAIVELTYQKFQNEAPTAMAGVDVPTSRVLGGRYADELVLKWKQMFKELGC